MSDLSVLVVDDDVDIAANVSDILTEFGYDVASANDGESALSQVSEKHFDIALLDFKMPGMDGATLYERIRKIQPQLVAIMVTAYAGSDGVERALSAGVSEVMRKPVDIQEVLNKIAAIGQQPLILVVDDDEDFCSSIWEVLRQKNYRVGIANSESEAREKCKADHFDIILLDLQLGADTSTDLLKSLETLSAGGAAPRAIVITGHRESMKVSAASIMQEGAESVFYKPLPLEELLKKIESLVSK